MSSRKSKHPANSSRKSKDHSVRNPIEIDDKYRITKLIKVLTTTGLDTLELKYFEELKSLCLCSKPFRNLLIENLRELFTLVLAGSPDNPLVGSPTPLPPPKCKAELLSRTAFLMIKQWNDLFGDKPKYFRLKMGYNHVCVMYNQEVPLLENSTSINV
ncbi:hypothetical protein WDU94_002635 [Cyamophila willieti]